MADESGDGDGEADARADGVEGEPTGDGNGDAAGADGAPDEREVSDDHAGDTDPDDVDRSDADGENGSDADGENGSDADAGEDIDAPDLESHDPIASALKSGDPTPGRDNGGDERDDGDADERDDDGADRHGSRDDGDRERHDATEHDDRDGSVPDRDADRPAEKGDGPTGKGPRPTGKGPKSTGKNDGRKGGEDGSEREFATPVGTDEDETAPRGESGAAASAGDPPQQRDANDSTQAPGAATAATGASSVPGGAGGAATPAGGPPPATASAPDDEEMPLAEHVDEMVNRLGWVVLVMLVVGAGAFLFADRMINFLWYSFLPGTVEQCPQVGTNDPACPYVYHPLSLMFARIKVAGLVGFVVALPVAVYQSYLFMRPGLYPRERRYYLASVPTSLVLAAVGTAFAYFLVLPALFVYFNAYTADAAGVAYSLTETFNLIVMMLGFFALIFQIPLFIMLAVMMGVTSRRWLAARRLYFWGGFATIAFLFSPDPTGMAPIIVAMTMIVLFEGTLLLLYWTGGAAALATASSLRARRPVAWAGAALAGYLASAGPLPESYYARLPADLRTMLADLGMTRFTPLVIGGALIAAYELIAAVSRRAGPDQVRRALARARFLAWPLALLVGYLGSPDPVLVRRVDAVNLTAVQAVGLAVGLLVAYELLILVLQWRRGR